MGQTRGFAVACVFLGLTLAGCSPSGEIQAITAGDVSAWTRATVVGAETGAVFATIENRGTRDDALVGAHSPAAGSVELHTMATSDGMMHMRASSRIAIPAGKTATFAPGANHIMLIGLKAPLKSGDRIALTLEFERAGAITVETEVK